jgi:hypothetical protein
MRKSEAEKLSDAVGETIVKLGIGGYVPSSKFKLVFSEIDATTFAKIMYATDQMLIDFEGAEATNETNIPLMIGKYNFEEKKHFSQVMGIFQKHFGSNVAHFD